AELKRRRVDRLDRRNVSALFRRRSCSSVFARFGDLEAVKLLWATTSGSEQMIDPIAVPGYTCAPVVGPASRGFGPIHMEDFTSAGVIAVTNVPNAHINEIRRTGFRIAITRIFIGLRR